MSTFFECCKIWLWRNRWLVFRLSFSLRLPVYHLKLYDWVEIWFALNPLFTNRDNIGGDHCCVLKQPDARYRSPLLGFSSASNETPSPCSLLCGSRRNIKLKSSEARWEPPVYEDLTFSHSLRWPLLGILNHSKHFLLSQKNNIGVPLLLYKQNSKVAFL